MSVNLIVSVSKLNQYQKHLYVVENAQSIVDPLTRDVTVSIHKSPAGQAATKALH